MKLQTKEFKDSCKTILQAIDNKESSLFNETLELKTSGQKLFLNVTNREYYCSTSFNLGSDENFHASVNASTFLKLVDKITTDNIEITIDGNSIIVKGNGKYKLPMVYNNDVMLELPTISIINKTNEMDIPVDILQSILLNNSKELLRGKPNREAQKYYYIDNKGCITFVSGACVNNFELPQDVKMQLSDKVVKLLKLFKDGESVKFTMGQDPIDDTTTQSKVKFESGNVSLIAKLPNSALLSEVPVDAIRTMASKEFPHKAVLDKNKLKELLGRLIIFANEKNYGYFTFTKNKVNISDFSKENNEEIVLNEECQSLDGTEYKMIMNLDNLTKVLDGCDDDTLSICFGDNRSVLIKKNSVSDLMPELREQ